MTKRELRRRLSRERRRRKWSEARYNELLETASAELTEKDNRIQELENSIADLMLGKRIEESDE